MKSKISTRVSIALLLMVLSAGAVPLVPFMGWDWLTQKSPDIIIATCKSTPPLANETNGVTIHPIQRLIESDLEVVSVLKGESTNKAPVTLFSRYRPCQKEDYLIFGRLEHGIFHSYETYRVVPLGIGFATNMLAGKSLDEQIKTVLKYRLQKLEQQLKEEQEEKKRLEQAFETK